MDRRLWLLAVSAIALAVPTGTSASFQIDDPGPHPDRGTLLDGTSMRHEIRDVFPPGCKGDARTWKVTLSYAPHDGIVFFELDTDRHLGFEADKAKVVEDGHAVLFYRTDGACAGHVSLQVTALDVPTTADYQLELDDCSDGC